MPASYEKLKGYIARKHLTITGNAYEFELGLDKVPVRCIIMIILYELNTFLLGFLFSKTT
jgi:hypothetical protein